MIGGACGAAGYSYVIQGGQQIFALDSGKTDVEISRQSGVTRSIHTDVLKLRHDPVAQTVAQAGKATGLLGKLARGYFAGFAQTHDPRNVQGSGAKAVLVPAAVDLRSNLQSRVLADVQSSHSLRAIKLVSRNGKQVNLL